MWVWNKIDECGLGRPRSNDISKFNLEREFDYDINQLIMQFNAGLSTLLPQQRGIFNLVINQIENNDERVIFIDIISGIKKIRIW